MPDNQNSDSKDGLAALIKAARQNHAGKTGQDGKSLPPVELWHPEYCGVMDMVIRADGSWWHEGGRITRAPLIRLFASILRKDEDGETYLVTPVEKIAIKVERGHFLAVRVDISGVGENSRVFFTTNMDEVIEAGPDHPIRVITDPDTLEPQPYIHVRGRLEALMTRPVFYELAGEAVERQTSAGTELGIWAGGLFFPLGPANIHIDAYKDIHEVGLDKNSGA